MKIVYLTDDRIPSEKGCSAQIMSMCQAFSEQGIKLVLYHPFRQQPVITQNPFRYYNLPETFQIRSLPYLDLIQYSRYIPKKLFTPLYAINNFIWGLRAVKKIRHEEDDDELVDVYYTRSPILAFCLTIFGRPTFLEIHTISRGAQKYLLRFVAKRPYAKLVVAVTSFIKKRLVEEIGFSENKIIVLPDAVDLKRFRNLPPLNACRRRLGLPLDRQIVGYVGRFSVMGQDKGISTLIEAVSSLHEPLLVCVGRTKGDDLSKYPKTDKVRLVDLVPFTEVPLWIKACDVVAIPWGWTEHLAYYASPLKLFEYMAAGTPIVATDLPSNREILNKDNAVLVEPGSAPSLAEGIKRVLGNKQLSDRMAAQALVEVQNYTWQRRAEKIINAHFTPKTEQLYLDKLGQKQKEEVLARYEFAAQFVKNKKVLDLACGSGYGSAILANAEAKEVVGADIDANAIKHARTAYQLPNLSFSIQNAIKIGYPDNYFDVIISYETIEHLNAAERRSNLSEFRRILKGGGLLILSTPNKAITSPYTKRPSMMWHKIEFTRDSLEAEVKELFAVKDWYGQRFIKAFFTFKYVRKMVKLLEIVTKHDFGIYSVKSKEIKKWRGKGQPKLMFAVLQK